MIPKYPFFVTVWRKIGSTNFGAKLDQRAKSFETLDSAHAFANSMLRASDVKRVQITCILDDSSRDASGNVLGFNHEGQR